ncbi:MAG: type II toxin-antitoxin system Phd/YefM family antitoxin [Geminicoccaceae bacterium]
MSDRSGDAEVRLGVTAFKPRSLDLIERVASGKLSRVVLTKRGRPVAALVPLGDQADDLWGALAAMMEPLEDIDLTEPTGERWVAEDG